MKYFTSELWGKINSENEEERDLSYKNWKINSDEYSKNYNKLEKRLPKRVYDFFKTRGFHDFQLIDLNISHNKRGIKKFPINVQLIISDGFENWSICYKKISKILVNYNCKNTPFAIRRGFDDWGYDEFLEVDELTLSHEILFASDTTILVHFNDKNVTLKKLKV